MTNRKGKTMTPRHVSFLNLIIAKLWQNGNSSSTTFYLNALHCTNKGPGSFSILYYFCKLSIHNKSYILQSYYPPSSTTPKQHISTLATQIWLELQNPSLRQKSMLLLKPLIHFIINTVPCPLYYFFHSLYNIYIT